MFNTDHLLIDPHVLGWLAWSGLGLGIVSLLVTLAGFGISLNQIAKVKNASDAARSAAINMRNAANSREHGARLDFAVQQLNVAKILLASNPAAAGAYTSAGHRALAEAQHLAGDKPAFELTTQIYRLRKILDELQGQNETALSVTKLRKLSSTLQDVTDETSEMAVKLKYRLPEIEGMI